MNVAGYDQGEPARLDDHPAHGLHEDLVGPARRVSPQDRKDAHHRQGHMAYRASLPLPMMRLTSVLMRLVNPTLARQIQAGVVMDTQDMSFEPSETSGRYRSIPPTGLADVVRRDYAD